MSDNTIRIDVGYAVLAISLGKDGYTKEASVYIENRRGECVMDLADIRVVDIEANVEIWSGDSLILENTLIFDRFD